MDKTVTKTGRQFYIVNHEDDIPLLAKGLFVPQENPHYRPRTVVSAIPVTVEATGQNYWLVIITTICFFIAVAFGATVTFQQPASLLASVSRSVATTPVVVIEHPYTGEKHELRYGIQVLFSEPFFFDEVRSGFIEARQTFLEVNLQEDNIQYFKDGVLHSRFSIINYGGSGSWGEVSPGLYKVESKSNHHFSSLGQVYLPSRVGFRGAAAIHGTPHYGNGEAVSAEYIGGSIWLSDLDAKKLYELVPSGAPVIVHSQNSINDSFVYEPNIPNIPAPHYLVADIQSNTILASSNLDDPVPIASLTKLMTALVATEELDLDQSVWIEELSFISSIIPRLQDNTQTSLYSLMQLLIIESSNEASEVIADQIGREKFIELMNIRAQTLGLTNTNFTDPSGVSAENTSTLRDLLRLTQFIHTHRRFILELSANQDLPATYKSSEFGRLINLNPVMGDTTFVGGKIGETRAAGQTSVTLHQVKVRGHVRTIAIIVLASEERTSDVTKLLEYVHERFADHPLSIEIQP